MRITKTIVLRSFSIVKKTTVFLLLFCSCLLCGQVNDNFSDGDFTFSPTWMGDTSNFIVSYSSAVPQSMQPALKLNGGGASDTSCLVVPNQLANGVEWQFWVKLSFNTSSNNFARVYLAADQADLKGNLNAYFIQIGGFTDSIGLFKQSGAEIEKLMVGANVFTGNSTHEIRVKVIHTTDGKWSMYADPEGGQAFLPEGECVDLENVDSQFFGLYCKYTSSNSSKFYFDDFYAGAIGIDSIPPEIIHLEVLSASEIGLTYSESININDAQDPKNYFLNKGFGHPLQAVVDEVDQQLVILSFSGEFETEESYLLEVENIKDLSGNLNPYQTVPFQYVIVQPPSAYDVVINEIMVDVNPSPPGLPASDYLELFNPGSHSIKLQDLFLKTGSSGNSLPFSDALLDKGEYIIVCDPADVGGYLAYGQVIGVPGFALNNSGQLDLINAAGQVIHGITYDKSLYGDALKSEGGWALEQRDPYNPCLGILNWATSVAPEGGSPGSINSIDAENLVPIEVVKIIVESDSLLLVEFNQGLGTSFLEKTDLITVDQGMGSPFHSVARDSGYVSFMLSFDQVFKMGKLYTFRITHPIVNCVQRSESLPEDFVFGVPEAADWNDVVINEILFNPEGEGSDFIELYNGSDKVINLAELKLGSLSRDAFGVSDTNYSLVCGDDHLLLPDDYVVLTKDPEIVQAHYDGGKTSKYLELASFPAYGNVNGTAVISNLSGKRIDQMTYDESQHHPLLVSVEGVSLERINPQRSSVELTNWHSASSFVGFATPGKQNSQYAENELSSAELQIDPYIFSPDNDGHHDIVNISYNFQLPGYVATLIIFDALGRPVRYLLNNVLLNREGLISWDGITEDGHKASPGIYIVYLEAFEPKGDVKKIKKALVVATKLN